MFIQATKHDRPLDLLYNPPEPMVASVPHNELYLIAVQSC
jgi:hypothetical protein